MGSVPYPDLMGSIVTPFQRGALVVPGEGGWMINRDTADATSASVRGAESEVYACRRPVRRCRPHCKSGWVVAHL